MVQNVQDSGYSTSITGQSVSRIITGGQFTDPRIYFGDTYYTENAVLIRSDLHRAMSRQVPAPTNIQYLVDALLQRHLVILQAPTYWRSEYEAEYLAYRLQEQMPVTLPGRAEPVKRDIYTLTGEASGSAVIDVLIDPTRKIDNAIILANSLSASKKITSPDVLMRIAAEAQRRAMYVIITTDETRPQWEKFLDASLKDKFYTLKDNPPFQVEDLATWLSSSALFEALNDMGIVITPEPLTPETELATGGAPVTIRKLAEELGCPGHVEQFLIEMAATASTRQLRGEAAYDRLRNLREQLSSRKAEESAVRSRIEKWFDKLKEGEQGEQEEVRYLVLAISLVDGLPQQTFWAIYEQLTQEAWRERRLQLKMTDYLEIQDKISAFITITSDQGVRFHNAEERRLLVEYALDGYRRSLIQALPVLADIVSGASRPVLTPTGSVTRRLRTLDIFGSEMEPTGENRQRQERLLTSISNSIARIALREQLTTEHLLLAWAEGTSSADSPEVNLRLRFAVTNTLVQMMTIEGEKEGEGIQTYWYQRSTAFEILHRWFSRYYVHDLAELSAIGTASALANRRSNIRATIGLALCHMGRYLAEENFGRFESGAELLKSVPPVQPCPIVEPTTKDGKLEEPICSQPVNSPWELLLALAWDPDASVRAGLAPGIKILLQRHRQYAEGLIILLASDWQLTVRETIAGLISTLFSEDAANLYLIDQLLDQTTPEIDRSRVSVGHYLYRETLIGEPQIKAQLWTATYAMFLIGINQPAAFKTFLRTRLAPLNNSDPLFKAFESVVRYVVATPPLHRVMRASVLSDILLDKQERDNSPSPASTVLVDTLGGYVQPFRRAFLPNTRTVGRLAWSLISGRQPREPEPTPQRLMAIVSQAQFADESVRDLIIYWIMRENPVASFRIRQALQANQNG